MVVKAVTVNVPVLSPIQVYCTYRGYARTAGKLNNPHRWMGRAVREMFCPVPKGYAPLEELTCSSLHGEMWQLRPRLQTM